MRGMRKGVGVGRLSKTNAAVIVTVIFVKYAQTSKEVNKTPMGVIKTPSVVSANVYGNTSIIAFK